MYIDKPLKEYLDDLGEKKVAPGGGSAAALAGALGAALLEMMARYTIGKARYKNFEVEATEILKTVAGLRKTLMDLVDDDVEAYSKFSAALKAKGNIDAALREATAVPFNIAQTSLQALEHGAKLVERCGAGLASDVATGGELLAASYEGARYNIEINLRTMKDEEFARAIRERLAAMDGEVAALRSAIATKAKLVIANADRPRGTEGVGRVGPSPGF